MAKKQAAKKVATKTAKNATPAPTPTPDAVQEQQPPAPAPSDNSDQQAPPENQEQQEGTAEQEQSDSQPTPSAEADKVPNPEPTPPEPTPPEPTPPAPPEPTPPTPKESKQTKSESKADPNIAKVLAWAQRSDLDDEATEKVVASVPEMVKTGLVWQNTDGTRDYIEGPTDDEALRRANERRQPGQRFLWNVELNK